MSLSGFMLLCLATTVFSASEVTVDIFVESQCPGCMAFVNDALKRALATEDLEKIVKIQLFPYGNARQTLNADGTYSFTCQHGPVECYGNLLDVCAQHQVQNSFDKLRIIQCIEEQIQGANSEASFDRAAEFCAPQFDVSAGSIHRCMESNLGNTLQHQVADVTDKLIPAHQYVPWIVANGNHDETHENNIQEDLVKWACTQYKGPEKIAACAAFLQVQE